MSTTQVLATRLERVEAFLERLKLNSYVAKAADTGSKIIGQPLSAGDRNLVLAATGTPDLMTAGEDVLAKAVNAFSDPETLLAFADRNIADPTTIGVVSGHLEAGDLPSARATVLQHVQRDQVAKAAEVMQQTTNALDDDMAGYDVRAAVSEITARIGTFERTLSALEARLTQMERRPQNVPAPVVPPAQNTIAKATGTVRRPQPNEETAEELLSQINAYVDSPSVVGTLSSLVAAGQYQQVRAAIASAKRAHEERKAINERKGFTQPSSSLTPR